MYPNSPDKGGDWGLMGGIFDPVHNGHLLLAESAASAFDLAGVLFVVSNNPPHREQKPVVSFDTRMKMVDAAIDGNDRFCLSDIEKKLAIPSYTLNIIDALRNEFPGVNWHLILGADNIAVFDTWYQPDVLVEKVKIIVAERPGYGKRFRDSPWYKRVEKFEMPLMEISSTMIRQRIKAGKSIRYLVPEKVRLIIMQEGLYR